MAFTKSIGEGSPHHLLAQLVGAWAGVTRTWIDPDAAPFQSQTQGSVQMILDGRFVLYLYESAIDDEPQHGMFTFGYDTTLDQYQASWVDSYHTNTAIMFCAGDRTGNGFFVLGSHPAADGGPDWGWRTELELVEPDQLRITAYDISPEGEETIATQTLLNRMKRAA
jgi:hypothetical protein